MNTEVLKSLGLTPNEISIYIALLKSGKTTITKISQMTNIVTSATYYSLENLIKKGIITYTIVSNKKQFQAIQPTQLLDIMERKKEEIEKIIPELEKIQGKLEDNVQTNIYEGTDAIRGIYKNILKNLSRGERYFVVGARQLGNEDNTALNMIIDSFHREREKRGISADIIFSKDVKDNVESAIKKFKYIKARYNNSKTNSYILIYKNRVINFLHTKNLIAIEMISDEISKSYRQFFMELWKQSKS